MNVVKKAFFWVFFLIVIFPQSVQSEVFWLNIPGAYSKLDEQYLPSISLPTASHDACSDAIVQYAKDNLVHYIGCDVKPLPDAINLRHIRHR